MSPSRHAPPGYVCPFCRLVAGIEDKQVLSVQGDVVFRDEATTAFVSSHQYAANLGHVLVIPNAHFENLYELPDEFGARVHATARRVALAMKAAYGCAGVSTRQHNEPAGYQDVWHYHLHVFPRHEGDELYTRYRTSGGLMPPSERAAYAARLRAAWPDAGPSATLPGSGPYACSSPDPLTLPL